MATEAYELARKSKSTLMAGGVTLRFPAFDALPAKTLRLGTMRFEADDEEFKSALKDMPQTRGQRGLGQDYSEFTVNDPQIKWYELIKLYEPVFEDTSVTVKECLFTKDQFFESEIVLEGYIEKFSLNESDMTLRFSILSDMSRTGFKAGGRILSQRYCIAVFPVDGSLDPEFDPCEWTRIVAVEGLTSAEIQIVSSGSCFDYGNNPCFGMETLVWMADDSYKPIHKVKTGDPV